MVLPLLLGPQLRWSSQSGKESHVVVWSVRTRPVHGFKLLLCDLVFQVGVPESFFNISAPPSTLGLSRPPTALEGSLSMYLPLLQR